jgi:uncharacterized protein with HEPN domain
MADRPVLRLRHIKDRIVAIKALLSGKTFEQVAADSDSRAALERHLEIISEASRHLPEAWKAGHKQIPWRNIADLGNVIRHAYDEVDLGILWDISEKGLPELERAVDALLKRHTTDGDAM